MESTWSKVVHPKKRAMLNAYVAAGGSVVQACKAARVGRTTHYRWVMEDEVYAEAFAQAAYKAGETLEAEAVRRATQGVRKVIYHLGVPIGEETVYSDTLLIFLMKGNMPNKYKDRVAQEISGPGGKPIQTQQVEATDAELDALAEMIE